MPTLTATFSLHISEEDLAVELKRHGRTREAFDADVARDLTNDLERELGAPADWEPFTRTRVDVTLRNDEGVLQ